MLGVFQRAPPAEGDESGSRSLGRITRRSIPVGRFLSCLSTARAGARRGHSPSGTSSYTTWSIRRPSIVALWRSTPACRKPLRSATRRERSFLGSVVSRRFVTPRSRVAQPREGAPPEWRGPDLGRSVTASSRPTGRAVSLAHVEPHQADTRPVALADRQRGRAACPPLPIQGKDVARRALRRPDPADDVGVMDTSVDGRQVTRLRCPQHHDARSVTRWPRRMARSWLCGDKSPRAEQTQQPAVAVRPSFRTGARSSQPRRSLGVPLGEFTTPTAR